MRKFIIVVSGIVFFSAGNYIWTKNLKIKNNGVKVVAKVIDYYKDTSDDSTIYFPIITFTDQEGNLVTQKLNSGSSFKVRRKTLEIYYLKTNGKYEVIRNDFMFRILSPWLFIIAGCIVISIGFKNKVRQKN